MKWLSYLLQLVVPLIVFWSGANSEHAFAHGNDDAGYRIVASTLMCAMMFSLFNIAQQMVASEELKRVTKKMYRAMSFSLELATEAEAYGKQQALVSQPPVSVHIHAPNRGYVYLLKEINGVHYKIGRTTDPTDRLRTFNVKLPYQVEYTCVIATIDMFRLERQLHTQFKSKRIKKTEWFNLSDEDVASIVALAQEAEG